MSNEKPILSWTSHPFLDNVIPSILVVIFMIFLGFVLWQIAVVQWQMPLFYYLGLGIFFISLLPYFIPTTYEFFEFKIRITYWFIKVERRYEEFGCYYFDKKGVMLSTFTRPRRLDNFRGQSLRFSKTKQEKEQLLQILADKIGKQA